MTALAVAALLSACGDDDGPTALPGAPVSLTASAATATAPAAQSVTGSLTIVVRDANGTGVPDQTVTFAVVSGGGSLAATTAVSGAGGVVAVPTWTFGKTAIEQKIRATLGELPAAEITGTVQTSYDIVVRPFGGGLTPAHQALFDAAVARIRAIVTGDLPNVQLSVQADSNCVNQAVSEIIDDLLIHASIEPIDGAGDILAAAGPCFIRSGADTRTVSGMMIFDEADVAALEADGTLLDVVTHEMLHVVGIGALWGDDGKNLLVGAVADGGSDPRYTGAQARARCQQIGGASVCASTVPVENLFGPGSADAHWRESVFGRELMTSRSEMGPMPLSLITIGGLADLGYTVNFAPFDAYTVSSALRSTSGTARTATRWERPGPAVIKRVDARGNVTGRIVRQ